MKNAAVGIPAIPSLMREINERRVIDTLRSNGALHAAEIARLIGLSKPTTADILRGLIDYNLIREIEPGEIVAIDDSTMPPSSVDKKSGLGTHIFNLASDGRWSIKRIGSTTEFRLTMTLEN